MLLSLAASGVLVFLYLRRLGAERVGAFVGGLCFALGPVPGRATSRDTATLVAAPLLPLVLLAAEDHMRRGTPARAAGLAVSLALLLLAGSPEAARAGVALVAGRLVVGHVLDAEPARAERARERCSRSWPRRLLAAPQLCPRCVLARDAGRSVTGLANRDRPLPGLFGLVLRYASHTPAASLALAALPLALTQTPIRVLGLALALCLALQWGRGPLAAPGRARPRLRPDPLRPGRPLALRAVAGAARRPQGARLRAYFLVAALASAAALSVAAAALGPLPEIAGGGGRRPGLEPHPLLLAGHVAAHRARRRSGCCPSPCPSCCSRTGRRPWERLPRRRPTSTRAAPPGARSGTRWARARTSARSPSCATGRATRRRTSPTRTGRASPAAAARTATTRWSPCARAAALGGMGVGRHAARRVLPHRPRAPGDARACAGCEVPAAALAAPRVGFAGDPVDVTLEPGRRRFFPLPIAPATEIQVVSLLSDAVARAAGRGGRAGGGAAGHRPPLRAQPARGRGHRGVGLGAAGRAAARRAPARARLRELDGAARRLRRATATSAGCACPAATWWTA